MAQRRCEVEPIALVVLHAHRVAAGEPPSVLGVERDHLAEYPGRVVELYQSVFEFLGEALAPRVVGEERLATLRVRYRQQAEQPHDSWLLQRHHAADAVRTLGVGEVG